MELVPDDVGNLNCQETWDRLPQLVYGSFTNVTQFVIPFTTIIICYAKIIIRDRISNIYFDLHRSYYSVSVLTSSGCVYKFTSFIIN